MKFWKYGNALIGILLSAFACNAEPSAPPPVRIAYNYCTLSYTFAYYSDAEWDAEIDRLAKAGYNVALVTDGTFKVWQATLRELGVFKPREATTSFEEFRKSLSVKHLRATY